ncbi:MAG: ATP-binding protein [Neglectibacter sp.]
MSIFVTGSNSTLLSGDLSTLLTGRAVEFEVLPFSFSETKEYFEGNGFSFTEEFIFEYLKWGGFPLRFEFLGNEESTRRYLTNLYDSIITKDIIKKSRGIDKKAFRDISLYILANAGKEFSAENIANYYNAKNNRKITSRTVYNYLDKMEKSYLLHAVKRYNLVGKSALQGREKFYAIDMGFRTINTNTVNFDDTFFLENIVYNELLFQGFTVFTGKTYKSEVDFVAIREGKKCFIQVSYLMSTQQTIDQNLVHFPLLLMLRQSMSYRWISLT